MGSQLEVPGLEVEIPGSEVGIPSFEADVPGSEDGVSSFVREALRSKVGIPGSEVGWCGLRGDRLLIPTESSASRHESLLEQNGDRPS